MEKQDMKTTVKLLIIIAEICFLFPFVMVSCSGVSIEMTGMELMTTISIQEEVHLEENTPPNYYLAAAFALGVVGLIFMQKSKDLKKGPLYAGYASLGSAILLLLFRSTFVSFYGLKGYAVDVEFCWGWWLTLLTYFSAAGTSFYEMYKKEPLDPI